MAKPKIHNIIVKFINNEANITELEILENWLLNPNNTATFNHFVEIEYLTIFNMKQYNIDKAKLEIGNKIKANKRHKRILAFKRISVAASVVFAIGFSYIFFNKMYNPNQEVNSISKTINNDITPGTNKAILTLANGSQVNLSKDETYKNQYVTSDGKKIIYKNDAEKTTQNEIIEYNDLTIPRGGEYFVVLADGSKVWLNSESKLKYPTKFIGGKERNVELIYGEAYFEISPSSKHNGSKFNVITKGQKVSVLGTEFNIKAYNDESIINTTLVEGKIQIEKEHFKNVLYPNQQAQLNLISNEVNIVPIDVSKEIAWVKGLFSFEEAQLEDMMKILSRWYNVDIIFMDSSKKEFQFTGILERSTKIEEILTLIKQTSADNELIFEIKDKIIIIK